MLVVRYCLLFLILPVQFTLCQYEGVTPTNRQTLIVVDKTNNIDKFKQSHADLIKSIEDMDHKLEIKAADDATLKLSKYSEFLYDNILLFCPQLDAFRGSVSVKDVLEFIDSGRNLLLTGSNAPGSVTSELASEVGFEFKESSVKRDYSNTKLNDIPFIIGDKSKLPSSFLYSGTQMKMLNNELSLEILSNSAPVDDIRPSSSSKYISNVLIGVTQARNNARVLVSGSTEFFSKPANKQLNDELLKWLLKEKSLLRYSDVRHSNNDGYTIMDDLEYRIKIEIYQNGKWSPYLADDVQFEFIRIDPFVRQTMTNQADGTYLAKFKVPDVYGVYKMEVDYKKEGLTYLFSSTQVSVRPLRHNEYERFIYSAYPYYLSAFLMMVYLYVYSFVYIHQRRDNK